jgi:CRP-like cAMP-binding protein
MLQTRPILKNTVIYKHGENPDNIYMVKSGEVELREVLHWKEQANANESIKILKKIGDGPSKAIEKDKSRKKTIAKLGTGTIFGEHEILDEMPRKFEAVCTVSGELYCLSKEVILLQFDECLEIQYVFEEKFCWDPTSRTNIAETRVERRLHYSPYRNCQIPK